MGPPLTGSLEFLRKTRDSIVSLWVEIALVLDGVLLIFISLIIRRERDLFLSFVKSKGTIPLELDYLFFVSDIFCDVILLLGFFLYLTRREILKQKKK